MVSNALAAASAGYLMGISLEEIRNGLECFKPVPGRLQIRDLATGAHIIDDTYNSSPDSALAALNLLSELDGRRIAVLGDMLELGSAEDHSHRLVGRRAADVADLSFNIVVKPSAFAKCVRCWHHREDVGSHPGRPELCGRCVGNVDGPGEARLMT